MPQHKETKLPHDSSNNRHYPTSLPATYSPDDEATASRNTLVVVDIDHLESAEEMENLRQQLFDDPYLCPALVFVSPTGRGVKAFVPCLHGQNPAEGIQWAMNYVHCMYDAENTQPGKGVDTSGKDLVRACFLCHDPKALLRKVVNFEL